MRRFPKRCVPLLLVFTLSRLAARAQESDAIGEAIGALQRGDLPLAENTLRAELRKFPSEVAALDVLGVVLDKELKFTEAGEAYRRAVAISPRNAGLLNNYGNHLVASGKLKEAHAVFLKVVALNPAQDNAHVQLARLALQGKSALEALQLLDRLSPAAQENFEAMLLKLDALYGLGRDGEADALAAKLSAAAMHDAHLSFSLGSALAAAGRYPPAEACFARTLELEPANFEALRNLGLAASHAGHNEQALAALQSAREKQPDNVDVLYDLAAVDAAMQRKDAAVELLARAARLAPDRADVQLLLAHTTADLGFYGDAVEAWDRYIQLAPKDDVGRRERAFLKLMLGQSPENIADIRKFVSAHPADPNGHYELGVVESATDPAEAATQFGKALTLKPDFPAARFARGFLSYREGKLATALPDFQAAAEGDPHSATFLDRLGQTYLALDRPAEAVEALRKAATLSPRDSKILLHFSRALLAAGNASEAAEATARVRELGPGKAAVDEGPGLVDFLGLAPEERLARYRAGVEKTVRQDPANVEAQVRYLELLLSDRKMDEAGALARQLTALPLTESEAVDAARALVAAGQYSPAEQLLEEAGKRLPKAPNLRIAHAINLRLLGRGKESEQVLDLALSLGATDSVVAQARRIASAHAPPGENETAAVTLLREIVSSHTK